MSMKEIKPIKEKQPLPAAPEPIMIKENPFTVFNPKTAPKKEVKSSLRPPLTKERFCDCIESIQEHWTRVRGAQEIFGMNFEHFPSAIMDAYIDLLVIIMRDNGEEDCSEGIPWIYAFCFNTDFGRSEDNTIILKDKVVTTAGELYEALVSEYWEKNND